ncbi:dermonecrotic toxin domain-containing protein [Pseudomonas sp. WC2]|uniref:dermonecrotic toxin domain-containing protein n=1 Tax=Pseudomonas sp. WC2 TaxID=3424773 RepID=UPI003D34328C
MISNFKSFMLGHEGEDVTSEFELVKAGDVLGELAKTLQGIPSVRAIARRKLVDSIYRLNKLVDINAVYIVRGKTADDIARRPAGSLSEVLIHCLENSVLPNYIQGEDGVYHFADTQSDKFKVQGLGIIAVEDAMTKVLQSLGTDLRSALDEHWKGHTAVPGGVLNNRTALQEETVKVLMAELSLGVIAGALKETDAARVVELMKTDTAAFFRIKTGSAVPAAKSLSASFIVDRSFHSVAEIKPDNTLGGWILYTPDNGFEYFSSSAQMHQAICTRFSLPSNEVTYPVLSKSVVAHYVDVHLQEQRTAIIAQAGTQAERRQDWLVNLEKIQQLAALGDTAQQRYELLKAAIKRNEWPEWLKKAGGDVQRRYLELEYSKERYEADYKTEFDRVFSLQDYVSRAFSEWTMSAFGEQLNADEVKIHSLYKMQVGGRTIQQKDVRTLREFLLTGLHDSGKRAQLTVEGAPANSRLVQGWLESWLNNRDLRVEFVSSIPAAAPENLGTALANCMHARMELALYVARHRGIYSDAEVAMIQRAMAGDPGIPIKGVRIDKGHVTALKDVLVFKVPNTLAYYVYVKTPADTFEFHKFAYARDFVEWFENLMSGDRRFAESIIRPGELDYSGTLGALRDGQLGYRYNLSYEYVELKLDTRKPLMSYVDFLYQFEVALHSVVATLEYRHAGPATRQQYARLDTEFRALATVDARENALPSFETFTRNLIKTRLEAVLKMKGESAEINPDLIMVQTDDFIKDLTTVLVEELTFTAPHPAYILPGQNPKFHLKSGHPTVNKLTIQDLAHLSGTLHPDDKYTQMLKDDYRTLGTPVYEFKRAVHAKKIRCEMHRAVLFDYFNGQIHAQVLPAFQRVIDRLAEKGDLMYDQAAFPGPGEGIFSLSLCGGRIVEGVYVFHLQAGGELVNYLYTPNAPDQKSFRPIEEFVGSIRHRPGPFREYYIKRVLIEDQKVVNDYFESLASTMSTVEPLKPDYKYRVVDLNGLHYKKIDRALRDIDERTTSLNELIGELVYDTAMMTASLVSLVVPPVGLAVTAVTMLKSAYSASEAYRRGDYSGAFWHGKDMLVALVSLGKAAALAGSGKNVVKPAVTRVQQSLFSLAKDNMVIAEWVAAAMGKDAPKEFLLGYIKDLMEEYQSSLSETTLH